MRLSRQLFLVIALAVSMAEAAQVKDMSGTWLLSVSKSRWGSHPKPQSGEIQIEHHEPTLKYKGRVATSTEDTRSFSFDGAIDGKDYPVYDPSGQRRMSYQRVNDSTVKSTLKTLDGKVIETATTTISSDGKSMERSITAQGPKGDITWTEHYERH